MWTEKNCESFLFLCSQKNTKPKLVIERYTYLWRMTQKLGKRSRRADDPACVLALRALFSHTRESNRSEDRHPPPRDALNG